MGKQRTSPFLGQRVGSHYTRVLGRSRPGGFGEGCCSEKEEGERRLTVNNRHKGRRLPQIDEVSKWVPVERTDYNVLVRHLMNGRVPRDL